MVVIDKEQIRLFEERLRGIGVDRRTFLKLVSAATAAPLVGSVLAACGGSSEDATATTAPAAAATATTAAPAATTAPEPTKATEASPTTAPEPTKATEASPTTGTTGEKDAEQIIHTIGARSDPASNDFNADLYCGGTAEIWAGLLTYDADFNVIPDWADKWEHNDDASMWTFYLRKDNKGFSNGDPVTADTFIGSWQRLLNPETKGAYASILFDIKGAQEINLNGADPSTLGCRAVDDWTLEVDMIGPRGMFPVIVGYAATMPTHLPSAAKGGNFTDPGEVGHPIIGNGPFVLTEWKHDEALTLERNPNYWNTDITLEHIDWRIIPAEQGMLPFEAGDVDWAVVPGADLPRVQADPVMKNQVQKWVEPLIWKILPGTNVKPFDDIELRRALQHSIDKERLNTLTNGGGDPAYCLVPPGIFGYFGEEFKDYSDFDVDKVKEHLGKSTYAGQDLPKVTMILRNEAQLNSTIMAEDVSAQVLDTLGMQIELQIMDFQPFRSLLFENTYELAWIRWYYDYPDPNNGYFDMFYSNKDSGKRQAWSNKEFDDWTIKGKEAAKPEDRLAAYKECERIMNEDVAYVPIVYRNAYDVYKDWVKGVPVNKQGYWIPNGNIFVSMYRYVYISGRKA